MHTRLSAKHPAIRGRTLGSVCNTPHPAVGSILTPRFPKTMRLRVILRAREVGGLVGHQDRSMCSSQKELNIPQNAFAVYFLIMR
jgi:hypothetical protein